MTKNNLDRRDDSTDPTDERASLAAKLQHAYFKADPLQGAANAWLAVADAVLEFRSPAGEPAAGLNRAPECGQHCQQAVDYGVWPEHSCNPRCVYLDRAATPSAGETKCG